MSEREARSESAKDERPPARYDPRGQSHQASFEFRHDAPGAIAATASGSEPESVTHAERVFSVVTATAVALLIVGAIGHLFLLGSGLVPFQTGEWGFADYSYLMLMALMSVALIAHSTLPEDALRPRTIVIVSSTIGGVGTLVAFAKGWLMLLGAAFAEEEWVTYSVFGATVVSILPFALPLAAGLILLRKDFALKESRTRAITLAVILAAAVIVVASLVPRWVGFA